MKKNLGVVQAVYPMPVLMVAAYDETGKDYSIHFKKFAELVEFLKRMLEGAVSTVYKVTYNAQIICKCKPSFGCRFKRCNEWGFRIGTFAQSIYSFCYPRFGYIYWIY